MDTTTAPRTPAGSLLPRRIALPLLTLGPVVTVAVLLAVTGGRYLLPAQLPVALWVAAALWSPLPLSVPALVLQDARDQLLPELTGPVGTLTRALRLVPALLASPVRHETLASLAGATLAILAALTLG